jgi:hypothetical protein
VDIANDVETRLKSPATNGGAHEKFYVRAYCGAQYLRWVALGIAGSALMIVFICQKVSGLAKVSGVFLKLASRRQT